MKKKTWSVLFAAFSLLLFANVASAHVTVSPNEVQAGAYQVFTVRVPSESKDKHTVTVAVDIPAEVKISRTQPVPGWSYELAKDADGKVTSITWTADGAGLAQTEFQDFQLNGRVEDNATSIVWKAHQTYDDGSVVDWASTDENAEFPASVTTVTAAAAEDGAADSGSGQGWPLGLSIAALVVAAAALVVSLSKRRKA